MCPREMEGRTSSWRNLTTASDISNHVSQCLQLAVLLEVSAYPKPGNVHRTADFEATKYEHYLGSAVALTPHFRQAAQQGARISAGEVSLSQVGIGGIVKNSVRDVMAWQHGGNTLLGSIILLVPMAVAAGLTIARDKSFSVPNFRADLRSAVENTTAKDAVDLYDSIDIANPGGLGKAPRLDVKDENSKRDILKHNIGLFEIFKISAPWDSISREWVNNYHIAFDIGYPYITQQLKKLADLNSAVVHTYLKILSEVPDTLITRKAGSKKAKQVSFSAKRTLEFGGLTTQEGRGRLRRLDRTLRGKSHKYNPGTTADITSAVLAITVLNGYRP